MKNSVHIALLRGINVGGKNCLPMSELRALFEKAGCREVKTYIQSGNVVFQATPALAKRLSKLVAGQIREQFKLEIPVVIRTAEELGQVAKNNPFLKTAKDLKALHVMFLADEPKPPAIATLDQARSNSDAFVVHRREIFLNCPNGLARTKLTNDYFDRKLATASTCRNWQTVLKLVELAGGLESRL